MNQPAYSPAKSEYIFNPSDVKRFFEIIQKYFYPNPNHIIGYGANTFIHPHLTTPAQKGSDRYLKC
jgi:pantothenate kinase type III